MSRIFVTRPIPEAGLAILRAAAEVDVAPTADGDSTPATRCSPAPGARTCTSPC